MRNIIYLLCLSLFLSSCTTKNEVVINKVAPTSRPTQIMPTGLPNTHLIQTAFVPQAPEKNWEEPWQDSCEEAAILTVRYYYEQITPNLVTLLSDYQQIFSYQAQNNLSSDINTQQMSQIVSTLYRYNSKIISNPTLEQIKSYISQDIPVIVPANGKTLYKENKHFKSGGPWYHNLVILGYDDVDSKFIVHDVGTQYGAYFKYSYDNLLSSIHDFPSSGRKEDIESGDKNILVLIK